MIFKSKKIIFLEILLLFWSSCYFLELLLGSSIWWRELGEAPSGNRIIFISGCSVGGTILNLINITPNLQKMRNHIWVRTLNLNYERLAHNSAKLVLLGFWQISLLRQGGRASCCATEWVCASMCKQGAAGGQGGRAGCCATEWSGASMCKQGAAGEDGCLLSI